MFFKTSDLKIPQYSQENADVGVSFQQSWFEDLY